MTIGSIIAFFASLWANVQRLRDAATVIGRLGGTEKE